MIPYEDLAAALAGPSSPPSPPGRAPAQHAAQIDDPTLNTEDGTDASAELDIGEVLSDDES